MKNLMRLVFSGFFLCNLSLSAELDFADFDPYQDRFDRATLEGRIRDYLRKDSTLDDFYSIDENELKIYSSLEDKEKDKPEYRLRLAKQLRAEENQPLARDAGLRGLRVAIDPGHIGGKFARTEERFVEMATSKIEFDEGTLTTHTALILKRKLEIEGAVVMLTRDDEGQFVFEMTFDDWKKSDRFEDDIDAYIANRPDSVKTKERADLLNLDAKFDSLRFRKVFNNLDLRARVNKVEEFKPDVTLMIHYNAINDRNAEGKNTGTTVNYNMVFVGGSFMKGDVIDQEARYHFLRLLLTRDLDGSIELSKNLSLEFERQLRVPIVSPDEKTAPYLSASCLAAGQPGVYCRNLGLTRLMPGAVAYGESLIQTNFDESVQLADLTHDFDGVKTSRRAALAAEAYFRAISATYAKK